MNKTYDFSEFLSDSMQADEDREAGENQIKSILKSIPDSTLAVKDVEYIDATASKAFLHSVHSSSEYFKQWNGRVISIENNDTFVAMVEAVKGNNEFPKIVRFNRKKVRIVNSNLMTEGAPFYWTVGLFRNKSNSLEKLSEVRFKMVPSPSVKLLEMVGKDLETLFDGISWMV